MTAGEVQLTQQSFSRQCFFTAFKAKAASAVTVGGLTSTTNTTTTTAAASTTTSTTSSSSRIPRAPPGSGSVGDRSQSSPDVPSQVRHCLCFDTKRFVSAFCTDDNRYASAFVLLLTGMSVPPYCHAIPSFMLLLTGMSVCLCVAINK